MDTTGLLKGLPSSEFEFEVDIEGSITKKKFKGTFKYRIPNIAKNSQIALMEARLNEGLTDSLDPSMLLMHYMISYLKYTLDEESLPEWWRESKCGYELYDPNIITHIYQECTKFEKDWQEQVYGKSSGESSSGSKRRKG